MPQPRSPPAPVEPKNRDVFRGSPESDMFDHSPKNQRDMFSQSRDLFASQQHLRETHEYRTQYENGKNFYGKDSTDMASSTRDNRSADYDSRKDGTSDIFDSVTSKNPYGRDVYSRDIFDSSNAKRDSFGMMRDVSPKSRDSFGMPTSRDFGVVPNTRDSFAVQRQNFKRLDREVERRSSVASTHHTDKMERIEIEEWPEFLKPVLPPVDKPEIEKAQEVIDTKLYPQTSTAHFTYNRVTWTLRVKKEVFAPNENLTSPLALHLVFCQVAYDVLATSSIRINKEDRQNMLKMLDNYGITLDNLQSTQHKITIKKNVVDMAKQWPIYFARIFPVSVSDSHLLRVFNKIIEFIVSIVFSSDRTAASGSATRRRVSSRFEIDQKSSKRGINNPRDFATRGYSRRWTNQIRGLQSSAIFRRQTSASYKQSSTARGNDQQIRPIGESFFDTLKK